MRNFDQYVVTVTRLMCDGIVFSRGELVPAKSARSKGRRLCESGALAPLLPESNGTAETNHFVDRMCQTI